MKTKALFGVVGMALALAAQAQSGASSNTAAAETGRQLGTLLFGNPSAGQPSLYHALRGDTPHNSVYYNTLMERLNAENAMAEAREHQQAADDLEMLLAIRQGLETQWGRFGLAPDMAHAVAWAFTPSDSDDAVFISVRSEAPRQVGDDIRAALGARNYQLANQLLLGYLKAAKPASPTQ